MIAPDLWPAAATALPATGTADLWLADVAALPADAAGLLDPSERARGARFRFPADRARFAGVRGLLRLLLGDYLGCPPRAVALVAGRDGKPAEAGGTVAFNLSHSGRLVVLAFAAGGEVGVDVERIRPLPEAAAIAAVCFPPDDRAGLDACPPGRREPEFFRLWTRHEALLKAAGGGLGGELPPAGRFTVHSLALSAGYAAALAVPAGTRLARLRAWPPARPARLLPLPPTDSTP